MFCSVAYKELFVPYSIKFPTLLLNLYAVIVFSFRSNKHQLYYRSHLVLAQVYSMTDTPWDTFTEQQKFVPALNSSLTGQQEKKRKFNPACSSEITSLVLFYINLDF